MSTYETHSHLNTKNARLAKREPNLFARGVEYVGAVTKIKSWIERYSKLHSRFFKQSFIERKEVGLEWNAKMNLNSFMQQTFIVRSDTDISIRNTTNNRMKLSILLLLSLSTSTIIRVVPFEILLLLRLL